MPRKTTLYAAAAHPECPSFVSRLETRGQLEFYARYAVGKNGGPSLAESVAERLARGAGDAGAAGLASGVVEDAAFEAVAQLAVAPPARFDPAHRRAVGFVIQHIRLAVRNRLNAEYGRDGERFGGHTGARALVAVGRDPGPSAGADVEADIARAVARDADNARRLERVKAVLPCGEVPADRDGRIATLRALGESKSRSKENAAGHRFYEVLAKHVAAALSASPSAARPRDRAGPGAAGRATDGRVNRRVRAERGAGERPAVAVPDRVVRRHAPVDGRRQREAERFVVAWETSGSAQEVARRLNRSVRSVVSYAGFLRNEGVTNLRALPARPGPLVRGVRALVPSRN